MSGAIYPGAVITRDLELRPDVCIVGSGPGGAVTAAKLTAAGLKVVMLEEGGYRTRENRKLEESFAYPALYQDQGLRSTADAAITILQGRTVGGGSVVNWTTSFRTPKKVLDHWARAFKLEGYDQAALDPHWDEVEKRLEIHPQPEDQHNPNNQVLVRGCKALGWSVETTRRNTGSRCMNSGYCGFGCPTEGKNDMVVTYLPDAVGKGLEVYANCRAERIELAGRKVSRVVARVLDDATHQPTARTVTVRPKVLVLSCGAINTPRLLLGSGIDPNGRTGKRTFLHPVVAMAAEFTQPIDGFYGAPQSSASHHFIDRGDDQVGFFLEAAPVHPMLAASAFRGFGRPLEELMGRLPHSNVLIGLAVDGFVPGDDGGEVQVASDGRWKLVYPLRRPLREAHLEACKAMAKIQFAAGAKRVLSLNGLVLESPDDLYLLERQSFDPVRIPLFSAHQMGGCPMGGDPAQSVVDSQLRHRSADNLFVVDGSVFPTSLGVNPQLSIYGLASYAASFVGKAV